LKIEESLQINGAEAQRLKDQLGLGDLSLGRIRHLCALNGIRQLEEIFCDATGLYTFGPSFLYATEYFLSPGGMPRSLGYPRDHDRLKLLKRGSEMLSLEVQEPLFERWKDSEAVEGNSADFVRLLDHAVQDVANDVLEFAFKMLQDRAIAVPSMEKVASVRASFERIEPSNSGASLGEIATAGWMLLRDKGGLKEKSDQPYYRILCDLMLKTIEVSEFQHRVTSHA
jgi:hypothetical protein